MDKYAVYIYPSYAVAAIVLLGLFLKSLYMLQRSKRQLQDLKDNT